MGKIRVYRQGCRLVLFLVFLGFFCANTIAHYATFMHVVGEEVEWIDLMDTESDKEDKTGEEDPIKKWPSEWQLKYHFWQSKNKTKTSDTMATSFPSLDILTPPPEFAASCL